MGMAASQVRLLQLTNRKHDIGFQLTRLSNDKVSLSRDMQRISRKYNDALNQKVLKWSDNKGVTYTDLTYQNLMKPSQMNQYNPYLISDYSGRIVLDSQYQKLASMISPDGRPGGDWESNKISILAAATGLDAGQIESFTEKKHNYVKAKLNLQEIEDKNPGKERITLDTFLNELCSGTAYSWVNNNTAAWGAIDDSYHSAERGNWGYGTMFFDQYGQLGFSHFADVFYRDVQNMKWFDDEQLKAFKDALNTFKSEFAFRCTTGKGVYLVTEDGRKGYSFSTQEVIDYIMAAYSGYAEAAGVNNFYDDGVPHLIVTNEEYRTWEAQYDAAKETEDKAFSAYSEIFTSDEVAQLDFYDKLFSTIAEKGWTANNQINDSAYLNQMLQNNYYTLTTVDRDFVETYKCDKCGVNKKCYEYSNTYSTDIASNVNKLFLVNNSDIREQALVDYEYEKSIINQKEKRIDTRMKDLETEQAAINQMMQGLDTVKNDNISRTMEIFG